MSKNNETVGVTLPQQKLDQIRKECEEDSVRALPLAKMIEQPMKDRAWRSGYAEALCYERVKREAERLRVEALVEKVDEFLRFLHDENMVELHDREPLMYALDQYRKNT